MRHTSIRAYNEIRESGLLGKRQKHAYHVLYTHGPMTGQELSDGMKMPGQWKRLNELKLRGLAKEVGERICKVTGRKVLIWDVTANLPKAPPKRVPNKEKIQVLERALRKVGNAIHGKGIQVEGKSSTAYIREVLEQVK